MPQHIIRTGDCITSVADAHGFYWKTLWDHAQNSDLKQLRKDPNMVVAGDVVFVPELKPRQQSCSTAARHRFKKKGIPAVLRLQVFDGQEPRADQDFTISVDGRFEEGVTDADGNLEVSIPADASRALLVIGEDKREYEILLGHLPPIEETEGVQTRLRNLGYLKKRPSGELDDDTRAALWSFQSDFDLEMSGEIDEPTKAELSKAHEEVNEFPQKEQDAQTEA